MCCCVIVAVHTRCISVQFLAAKKGQFCLEGLLSSCSRTEGWWRAASTPLTSIARTFIAACFTGNIQPAPQKKTTLITTRTFLFHRCKTCQTSIRQGGRVGGLILFFMLKRTSLLLLFRLHACVWLEVWKPLGTMIIGEKFSVPYGASSGLW